MSRSNRIVNGQARAALDALKFEIAAEFGVTLSGNTSSRLNGSVGGEMTKRLVIFAEQQMSNL